MSDDPDTRNAVIVATGLASTVGAFVAAHSPGAGVFLSTLPQLAQVAVHHFAERASRREATFLKSGDAGFHEAEADAEVLPNEASRVEDIHETVAEGFRQMMDAVDDAVVPSLGRLTGRYVYERRRPDRFFRALGRFLCDIEAGEFEELVLILAAVARENHHGLTLRGNPKWEVHNPVRGIAWRPSGATGEWRQLPGCEAPVHWKVLFALLKEHKLGEEHREFVQIPDKSGRPDDIVLDEMTIRRIREVVDPPVH